MEVLDALRQVPLFSDLDAAQLELLTKCSKVGRFRKGRTLLIEEEEGKSLFVLLEGRVRIERKSASGRTAIIALREPGDHFGEMSLLDGMGHSADVVAIEDCQVVTIARQCFVQTVLEHPSVALAVIRSLSGRLREQADDLARSKTLDLTGKICAALLDLSDAEGHVERVTQQQLAHQAGATRESVNRTLQALRQVGYIEGERGRLRVLDSAALRRRADELGSS